MHWRLSIAVVSYKYLFMTQNAHFYEFIFAANFLLISKKIGDRFKSFPVGLFFGKHGVVNNMPLEMSL